MLDLLKFLERSANSILSRQLELMILVFFVVFARFPRRRVANALGGFVIVSHLGPGAAT